jgi:hypothetical protein
MAEASLSPKERADIERATEEHQRGLRIEELVGSITSPMYRWRMASGIARDSRRVEQSESLFRSAVTRRANAERDLEEAVKAWYQKHFEDE